MGARRYTDDELATLLRMAREGCGLAEIGATLGRSKAAISIALRNRGLCICPEAAARRRIEMNRARKGERREGRPLSPEHRARIQAWAKIMNSDPAIRADALAKMRESRRTPESRAKSKAAREKQLADKFGDWPPQFREQYRFLTRKKNVPAPEARAMILPQIDAWMRTFEGQLWRVATGKARLVANVKIARPAEYVASEMAGAMS